MSAEFLIFLIGAFLIVLISIPVLKPLWEATWELKSLGLFILLLYFVVFILAMVSLVGIFIFLG